MRNELHFVCLGDSLTAGNPGFSGYGTWSGNIESWFGYWLDKLTQETFPNITAEFLNYGVGGDVVQQMVTRFNRDVRTQLDEFEYILVMGGNNDVVWRGKTPRQCLQDLELLFAQIQHAKAQVIALEILPVTMKHGFSWTKRKHVRYIKETNQGIHDLGVKMKIPVVNLYDALADESNNCLAKPYDCGDGEHLSVAGYRKVGEVIFATYLQPMLKNLLEKEK